MEKKYIIGAGLVALGLFAYSRYAKKDESGQQEEQGGGGGGIGGGGFGGAFVNPITNQTTPSAPSTPAKVGITPVTIKNPTILKNLGAGTPTAATTSSTGAGAQSGVTMPTGGIKPVVRTGSSSTSSSGIGNTGVGVTNTGNISGVGSTMTGTAGGTVFKPFDGCEPNRRRTLFLSDLVRSWNRP
jgi:hypothetical protein